jgi:hypothetical protein
MKAIDMYSQLSQVERDAVRTSLINIALWGTGIAAASAGGALTRIPSRTIAPFILAGIAIPSVAYYRSPALKRVMRRVGPDRLTLAHAWRIAAGIAFLRWGASGKLPKTFTNRAGWGDIASGVVALGLILARKNRPALLAANVFGAADLAVAIATGMTMVLRKEPAMRSIATFPPAMIPLFGVGLTGAAHVVAFDLLRRGNDGPLAARP